MRPITTLGNESHVVAISTYCHDSALIATNTTVAIDPISCSSVSGVRRYVYGARYSRARSGTWRFRAKLASKGRGAIGFPTPDTR
jgi:hypothetical protein